MHDAALSSAGDALQPSGDLQRTNDALRAANAELLREVARLGGSDGGAEILTLKVAEAAHAESEGRYRTLFNSIDEGFCVVELLRDAAGAVTDYRFTEVNPAFATQSGLHDAVSRTIRELNPHHEEHWFEIFGRVAQTGMPERFVQGSETLGRCFDVYAFPPGTGESDHVAILFTDVTERQNADRALRMSEERLRRVLNVETVGISFFVGSGRVIEANESFLAMTGFTQQDVRDGHVRWDNMTPPDQIAHTERAMAELRTRGKATAYEKEFICKDGTRRWGLFTAARLSETEGVEHMVDISEHKRAQGEIDLWRQRLEAVLDQMPVGVILREAPSGRVVFRNAAAARLIGLEIREDGPRLPEMLGAIHPDGTSYTAEEYPATRSMLTGRSIEQEEMIHRRPDGPPRRLSVSSAPITNAEGEILASVTAIIDIEERRMAEDNLRGTEAELAASRERLRLIIESARDYAIVAMDLQRRVTNWNLGAERLLGYTADEILGQPGDLIFTEADRSARAPESEAMTAMQAGRAVAERWHLRKDGSCFWGSGEMMAMRGPGGEVVGLAKIFRDQTDARNAQDALETGRKELVRALQDTERARQDAEAAGRAKDHFLAVLSHELRTPLTPVLVGLHMLKRLPNLTPATHATLEMIRRNVQLEARLIDDLLDVTRISRGKLEINREHMHFHTAIQHALEVAQPDLEGKAQLITVSLEATKDRVTGDSVRLKQLVWNLLKNASKFTPAGGAISVRSWNGPGSIILEVHDTGIGIAPSALPLIFEAFAQGAARITQEYGGLGLGLAIARATAGAHGGLLRADSAGVGQGAVFTVELPLG